MDIVSDGEYIELAKHGIGLERKKLYTRHGKRIYRSYRNYYSTGKIFESWELMVQAGYADRDEEKNPLILTAW